MTTGVLFVAHGSLLSAANQELFDLIEAVKARGTYALVEPAFLEGASPSLPEGLSTCVAKGADKVVVIPYFLLLGKHVTDDLPRAIAAAKERFPPVEFVQGEHLSFSERLGAAVLSRIRETGVLQWEAESAERGERHGSDGDV